MFIFEDRLRERIFGLQVHSKILALFFMLKEVISWSPIFRKKYMCSNAEFLKIFTFVSILSVCSAVTVMGEQCDWTGSGLEMSGGKSTGETRRITPIYLRCSQGRVSWVYPRGGLRVLLRLGSTGKEFRGCIKVNPTFAGARIFLEENKNLKELYAPGDSLPVKRARCFHSRGGQTALYIEAATPLSSVFPKFLAEFSYDLESVLPNSYDLQDRCKPCDNEELTRAFCTNDLVVIGSIESINHEDAMDDSEIMVRVDKFLKYSAFENEYAASMATTSNKPDVRENEIPKRFFTITMPKICKSQPGAGLFVFMARKRFDEHSLVCAPRWEDWKQLAWRENQSGNSHCVLSY